MRFKKTRSLRGIRLFIYRFCVRKTNKDKSVDEMANDIYEDISIFDTYGFDDGLKNEAEFSYSGQLNIVQAIKVLAENVKETNELNGDPPKIWVTASDLENIAP